MGFSRWCSEPWQGGCWQGSGHHLQPHRSYLESPSCSWALKSIPLLSSKFPPSAADPPHSCLTTQTLPWLLLNCMRRWCLYFCSFGHFQTAQHEQGSGGNDQGSGEKRLPPAAAQICAQLNWLCSSDLGFLHTPSFVFYFSLLISEISDLACLFLPLSRMFPLFHSFCHSRPAIFSPGDRHLHLLYPALFTGLCRVTCLWAYSWASRQSPGW